MKEWQSYRKIIETIHDLELRGLLLVKSEDRLIRLLVLTLSTEKRVVSSTSQQQRRHTSNHVPSFFQQGDQNLELSRHGDH